MKWRGDRLLSSSGSRLSSRCSSLPGETTPGANVDGGDGEFFDGDDLSSGTLRVDIDLEREKEKDNYKKKKKKRIKKRTINGRRERRDMNSESEAVR